MDVVSGRCCVAVRGSRLQRSITFVSLRSCSTDEFRATAHSCRPAQERQGRWRHHANCSHLGGGRKRLKFHFVLLHGGAIITNERKRKRRRKEKEKVRWQLKLFCRNLSHTQDATFISWRNRRTANRHGRQSRQPQATREQEAVTAKRLLIHSEAKSDR